MPPKKSEPAPEAAAPKPISYLSVRRYDNGYVVSIETPDDRSATVHHTAEQALATITKALIPAPKPARKPAKPA